MPAAKKPRNFVHVPFDRMTCPVDGCSSLNGGPQEGTVPGIKRHVRRLHKAQYDKIDWPAIRETVVVPDDLSSLKVDELENLAKNKGVKGYSSMKKDELVKALTSA